MSRTPEGKTASSRNAVTHGIFTSPLVLRNENNAEFLRLERGYLTQWNPVGPLECLLVDQMIAADWRLRRIWQTETARLDLQMDRDSPALDQEFDELDEQVRASVALEHLGDQSRFLDHMHRYEARLTRQLERTSRHLAAVQELRARQTKRRQPDTKNLPNELEPAA